jgi:hypothetical protein
MWFKTLGYNDDRKAKVLMNGTAVTATNMEIKPKKFRLLSNQIQRRMADAGILRINGCTIYFNS